MARRGMPIARRFRAWHKRAVGDRAAGDQYSRECRAYRNGRSGLCRSRLRRLFLGIRHRSRLRRQGPVEDRETARRRASGLRTGAGGAGRIERECRPALLHHRSGRSGGRFRSGLHRGRNPGTPWRRRGQSRPCARGRRGRRPIAGRRLHGGGDEIDGPRRHRPRDRKHRFAASPARQLRHSLQPRISARGIGDRRFHAPRPGGDRRRERTRRRGPAGHLSAAFSARNPDRSHRARDRGDDQIRRQRVSCDQDHLHQRDRRSVREAGRGRAGRRPRHRARRTNRSQIPPCRAGLWGVLPAEGHARAGLHCARGRRARAHRGGGHRGQ